ncbi:peptidase family S66 [Hypoxylon argillaceum]|nr:peptidase family S66 [Hypoxylon argillaceum]
MPSPLIPKALEPGATIAFVSPSARLNHELPAVIERATALFTSKGYKVRVLYTVDTGVQNGIANRLRELRTAFTDPTISAVFCTIGGPSFTELLPALLADTALHAAIRAHPKIVVGYSDITGLHWFLHAVAGLRTFYGPGAIPELGAPADPSIEDADSPVTFCARNLLRAITDSTTPIGALERSRLFAPTTPPCLRPAHQDEPGALAPTPGWVWIRQGQGQGRLFGGCLTVMARLGGVRGIAPDWRGRVVFVETAIGDDGVGGNPLGRVRAGLADLIAQGVFEDVAGLVVGRPFGYHEPEMRERYVGVIRDLFCDGPLGEKDTFPILFNVDFGHTSPMVTLPYDTLVSLDSEKDEFAILESAVV